MSAPIKYWPSLEQVEQCMRTEAETVSEALLLAVHEPVTLLRRSDQNTQDTPSNEQELLAELMRPVGDGSAVIVAITGASGVGKSHMVRWLQAQLQRHPRRGELVIVTIPKTASLRRVVELILEPLQGETYAYLRQDLARTADAMSPEMASALLGTALAEELDHYAKRIEEQLRAGQIERSQGPRVLLARHLRAILRDPAVQDAWFRQVLLRIVHASLSGTATPADRQFQVDDLVPPGTAAASIQTTEVNRALQYLANSSGNYRETAAEILQELLDPALRTIFRFTQALQQRTVQEVVEDIRKQLLADGKELVLLIEDLAALSGIQQPLMDIMIAEADVAGHRVRAPIRTAVAVTDGFLVARQTVLTRARGQWVVQSEGMSEEEVLRRLTDLTGRYLNAARFGVHQLELAFRDAGANSTNLYDWVPRYENVEGTDDTVVAFGQSNAGHSLFPFNAQAVRSLAAHQLRSGDAWIFNPRNFINEVLRRTLRLREDFQKGRFPPPDYVAPKVPTQVALELGYQGHSVMERARLESTLFHWAGNPARLDVSATVPVALFAAFGLPWPFARTNQIPSPAPPRPQQPSGPTPTAAPVPAVAPTPAISAYGQVIEEWSPDVRIAQTFAHRTRTLLTTALQQRLDMSELALQGLRIETRLFWLPPEGTVSNPGQGQLHVRVANPDSPIPASVRAGLQALDRWEVHGKRWDYTDAESDYARADVLLDDLENRLMPMLLDETESEVSILLSALHRQSLVAGLGGSAAPEEAPLRLVCLDAPADLAIRDDDVTPVVRKGLEERRKALAQRGTLQSRLRACSSCFQGTGNKPFAVDSDRIKKAWRRDLPERWTLGLKLREDITSDAADVLERLSPGSLDVVLRVFAPAVESVRPTVAAAFGAEHARVAWREAMKACVERSIQLSMWPTSVTEDEVRKAIEQLSTEGAETAIAKARRMSADDPTRTPIERLAGLAGLPFPQLAALYLHVAVLERFLRAQAQLIRDQISVDDATALSVRDSLLAELKWEE